MFDDIEVQEKPDVPKASPAQRNFILSLIEERDVKWGEAPVKSFKDLSREDASRMIGWLKKQPFTPVVSQDSAPEGRYAVEVNKRLRFFKVSWSSSLNWRGRAFVTELIGGPGQFQWRKVGKVVREEVLKRIEEVGAEEAMRRFGAEIGKCGRCGSPLTDEDSRAYGLGPVCREKV